MERVEINKTDKEARLSIDTRFYEYDSVLLTAKAFAESCWVYVDGDINSKLMVCLKPKSGEVSLEEVGYEFYNYVLGLMKNAGE